MDIKRLRGQNTGAMLSRSHVTVTSCVLDYVFATELYRNCRDIDRALHIDVERNIVITGAERVAS